MLVMVLMDTEPIVGTLGMRWEWNPDPSQIHSIVTMRQFNVASPFLGCGRKLEKPKETHIDMGITNIIKNITEKKNKIKTSTKTQNSQHF